MTCTHADTLIQKSLDGRLTPDERTRLDAHLGRCPACRAAWDGYRRLTQTATDWARHPVFTDDPGDAFTALVLAQIAARPAPSVPTWRLASAFAIFALSLIALSFWAGPLLLAHLPPLSLPIVDAAPFSETLQSFRHLPQDALDAWAALTVPTLTLSNRVWIALAAMLALNGAFVWRARRAAGMEAAR